VFLKPAGGWALKPAPDAFLTDSATSISEGLSVSVDAAGDTIVDGAASFGSTGPCYAHVFVKPAAGWSTATAATATLTEANPVAGDLFGVSVAISGDGKTVVAGAQVSPGSWAGNHGPGAAYVYVNSSAPAGWKSKTQDATLMASGGKNGDFFGHRTSLTDSGSTIVVGAPNSLGNSTSSGTAYVFQVPGGGWNGPQNENQMLTASSGTSISGQSVTPTTGFAIWVSISGDGSTVGIGQDLATVNGTPNQQVVLLFQ